MDSYLLISLVTSAISLIYGIFMIKYLNSAAKCDKQLSEGDRTFRKVALVVSWISVVLAGLSLLGCIILMLSTDRTYSLTKDEDVKEIVKIMKKNRKNA